MAGKVALIYRNGKYMTTIATKEIGLEVNADKNKHTVTSRDQNAVRNNNIKNENTSFESVEEFKYLGTSLTNKNSIQK